MKRESTGNEQKIRILILLPGAVQNNHSCLPASVSLFREHLENAKPVFLRTPHFHTSRKLQGQTSVVARSQPCSGPPRLGPRWVLGLNCSIRPPPSPQQPKGRSSGGLHSKEQSQTFKNKQTRKKKPTKTKKLNISQVHLPSGNLDPSPSILLKVSSLLV